MIGLPSDAPRPDGEAGAASPAAPPSAWRRVLSRLGREPARSTAWALLDQGATVFASLLAFLLLGRTMGAAGYGAYIGLYALIGPFTAVGQTGVYLAVMEHIARDGESPAEVGRSCMSITVVTALVCVPLLSAMSVLWIKGLPALAAVVFVATEFLLNGIFMQSVGIVQVMRGFPAAARLRILNAILRVALLVSLAAGHWLTLTVLAVTQALALGAFMLFAVSRTSRLAAVPMLPGAIRWRHVRSVLLYGAQIGASNVQSDGDKFVLNAAHHQADAGRYGAASRIMLFALLPVYALVNATHVSFLKTRGDANAQVARAWRSSLTALVYAAPAAIGLFLVAPLAPLLLTRDFSETTRMLQWLAPLVLLRMQSSFPLNGLMGLGQNALRTKLMLANAVLSLVLFAALIPRYSWRGALVASLVTELTGCIAAWTMLLLRERERRPTAEI